MNNIKLKEFTNKKYYKNNIYKQIPFEDTDIYIITKIGDRLDTISQTYYGTPNHWKYIAALNNNITKGSIFPTPGTQLRIPLKIK